MEMQKLGYDPRNEGWKYIRLPQSIYLTSPTDERYYFGYSDPRFKYFFEAKSSFREILTYSFLGFGEFNRTAEGLWSNNNFSVPSAILDMLLEATTEVRVEQFLVWRNLFTRDPELVREVAALKRIFPYTRDGMYLYGQDIRKELQERLLSLQGIVFFPQPPDSKLNFEEELKAFGLPDTKVFRKALLGIVTKDFCYRPQAFNWASFCFQLYGLDNTQNLMRDIPDFFHTSDSCFKINTESFATLARFLGGVTFPRFRKLVEEEREIFTHNLFDGRTEENMKWLETNFTLDPKNKDKQYFWAFVDRHKISVSDAISLVGMNRNMEEMLKPVETDIPVLYKDETLEFRMPRNCLELYGWGKRLHNCLHQESKHAVITRRQDRGFIFGIFEKGNLIGALELTAAFRIVELRAMTNKKFDTVREQKLQELVRIEIKKINPLAQMRKALRWELEDILERRPALGILLGKLSEKELKVENRRVDEEKIVQATKKITDFIQALKDSHVIDDKQQVKLCKVAPQIIRRTVDQLGTKVPDSLRALVLRSKRPRARRETPPVPCAQPLSD